MDNLDDLMPITEGYNTYKNPLISPLQRIKLKSRDYIETFDDVLPPTVTEIYEGQSQDEFKDLIPLVQKLKQVDEPEEIPEFTIDPSGQRHCDEIKIIKTTRHYDTVECFACCKMINAKYINKHTKTPKHKMNVLRHKKSFKIDP